eukprot:6667482-Pyramimonas_sp.AAC.1
MVPIIWSAAAEDASQTVLDWIQLLLTFSGDVFNDPTSADGLTAARVRERYDNLSTLSKVWAFLVRNILLLGCVTKGSILRVDILGGYIPRNMQQHIFNRTVRIRPGVARLELACVYSVSYTHLTLPTLLLV